MKIKNIKIIVMIMVNLTMVSCASINEKEVVNNQKAISSKDNGKTINLQERFIENKEVIPYGVVRIQKYEGKKIIIKSQLGKTIEPYKIEEQDSSIKIYPPKSGYKINNTYRVLVSDESQIEVVKKFRIRNFNKNEERQKQLIRWKVGYELQEDVQNDRNYDWYINQSFTGEHSDMNCGPSSVTMVAKWYNEDFNKTAEDARNYYMNRGGNWYQNNIKNYLKNNGISVDFRSSITVKGIAKDIRNGYIIIVCYNTKYLKLNIKPEERIGKFYLGSFGHFAVIKGYVKMDDKIIFTVYDPLSGYEKYSDKSWKGKNRFYSGEEIVNATKYWSSKYIRIKRKKTNENKN